MIGESVRLVEVLKAMETGEPFTIRFVTCDVSRKTGGQILEWSNCRLSKLLHERRGREAGAPAAGEEPSGMPAHYKNGTRNLVVGASTQVRKVHVW